MTDNGKITLEPGPDTADEWDELREKVTENHNENYQNDELFTRLVIAATYEKLLRSLDTEENEEIDLRHYQ